MENSAFLKSGKRLNLVNFTEIMEELKPGAYTVTYEETMMGAKLNLDETEIQMPTLFQMTEYDQHIKDWLYAFENRKGNLGVLLHGFKGSGKSFLAKKLAVESNLPVLFIKGYVPIGMLDQMLENSKMHKIIVIFDEFEKNYNQEDDKIAPFLSMLDGSSNTRALFVLTTNNKVNDFLKNRLGRIRYSVAFNPLNVNQIKNILSKCLEDLTKVDEVASKLMKIKSVSIDNVINIADEINMFPDRSVIDSLKMLNLTNDSVRYTISETVNGVDVFCDIEVINNDSEERGVEFGISRGTEVIIKNTDFKYEKDEDGNVKRYLSNYLRLDVSHIKFDDFGNGLYEFKECGITRRIVFKRSEISNIAF